MESSATDLTLTQRILVRAAELISIKENWIKGLLLGPGDHTYCMLGAINRAATEVTGGNYVERTWFNKEGVRETINLVADKLAPSPAGTTFLSEIPVEVQRIHRFNDKHATTHEDVKAVFCKAVKEELGYDPTVGSDDTPTE